MGTGGKSNVNKHRQMENRAVPSKRAEVSAELLP